MCTRLLLAAGQKWCCRNDGRHNAAMTAGTMQRRCFMLVQTCPQYGRAPSSAAEACMPGFAALAGLLRGFGPALLAGAAALSSSSPPAAAAAAAFGALRGARFRACFRFCVRLPPPPSSSFGS